MLGVDIPDGFKDTFRRPRATEFLHESRMAHQPRESREKLDVLRLASGRRQQEEENPTRLMLRRSERDRVRRDGYEQDRGIHTAHRGVRNGDAMPNRRRVESFTFDESLADLSSVRDDVLIRQVL